MSSKSNEMLCSDGPHGLLEEKDCYIFYMVFLSISGIVDNFTVSLEYWELTKMNCLQ